jgi:hypothetical protein
MRIYCHFPSPGKRGGKVPLLPLSLRERGSKAPLLSLPLPQREGRGEGTNITLFAIMA